MKKPKPVNKNVVCSECGLAWESHTARMKTNEATPTLEDCVALLKAEAAKPRYPQQFYAMAQGTGISSGARITNAISPGSGGYYSA